MTSSTDAPITAQPAHLERRLLGWLIDLAIVALLTGAVYLTSVVRISGCKPFDETTQTFPPSCPFANVTERVNDQGRTEQIYVLDSGREIPASTPTFAQIVVDPPSKATYLVPLAYLILMWGVFQGLTGWTPGRKLTGTRLVGANLRPPGVPRALIRFVVVDGLIALIGVAAGLTGQLWLVRFLAANAAVGAVGIVTALLAAGNRGLGDRAAGTFVVNAGDAASAAPKAFAVDQATTHRPVDSAPTAAGRAARAAAIAASRPVASAGGAYADSTSNESVVPAPAHVVDTPEPVETIDVMRPGTPVDGPAAGPSADRPAAWPPRRPAQPLDAVVAIGADAPLDAGMQDTANPADSGAAAALALPQAERPSIFGNTSGYAGATPAEPPADGAAPPPRHHDVPLLAVTSGRKPAVPAGLDFSPRPDRVADTPAADTPAEAAPIKAPPVEAAPIDAPTQVNEPAAISSPVMTSPEASAMPAPVAASPTGNPATRTNQTAPEWDAARRAYIFWNGDEWLQYDYARQSWGPISR